MTEKEIQILPRLTHRHIVRYFYCWIEDPITQAIEADDTEASSAIAGPDIGVDEISDPFAPPDPRDPFAYNASAEQSQSHSKSMSFPPVRFSLATRRFDEATSSDEDEDDSESGSSTSDEEDDDSGEETESEHPVVRAQAQAHSQIQKQKQNGHAPPTQSSAITGSTNSDPTAFRTLYIVMEFVDNVGYPFAASIHTGTHADQRRALCGNS